MKVNKYIEMFFLYLSNERLLSENTIRSYGVDLKCFNKYCLKYEKKIQLHLVDKKVINSYLKFLYGKNLSVKTVIRRLATIRSFYKFLKRKKISANNLEAIKGPKITKKLPDILSEKQIKALLNKVLIEICASERDILIIEIFYSTGIRISEITSIKIENIDLIKNSIKIYGKGDSERIVIFGKRLKEKLFTYINNLDSNQNFLFQSRYKNLVRPLSNKTIYNIVKKYFKLISKNEKLSPHSIRHSFATHMLNNGADILTVKELLGHKSLSTTQIYTQVQTSKIKETYVQAHPHGK